MKALVELNLKPFTVPNFAVSDGFEGSQPLRALSDETLYAMCKEFVQSVYKKANKKNPPQFINTQQEAREAAEFEYFNGAEENESNYRDFNKFCAGFDAGVEYARGQSVGDRLKAAEAVIDHLARTDNNTDKGTQSYRMAHDYLKRFGNAPYQPAEEKTNATI